MLPVVEFNTSLSKCRKYLLLLSLLFSFTFRIFEMFRSSQMFAENTFNFHRFCIAKNRLSAFLHFSGHGFKMTNLVLRQFFVAEMHLKDDP